MDLDWLEGGEKGVMLGFKEDEGRWTGGVAEAERGRTPLTARPAVGEDSGEGGRGSHQETTSAITLQGRLSLTRDCFEKTGISQY
jgi:hypothetical protein